MASQPATAPGTVTEKMPLLGIRVEAALGQKLRRQAASAPSRTR